MGKKIQKGNSSAATGNEEPRPNSLKKPAKTNWFVSWWRGWSFFSEKKGLEGRAGIIPSPKSKITVFTSKKAQKDQFVSSTEIRFVENQEREAAEREKQLKAMLSGKDPKKRSK